MQFNKKNDKLFVIFVCVLNKLNVYLYWLLNKAMHKDCNDSGFILDMFPCKSCLRTSYKVFFYSICKILIS